MACFNDVLKTLDSCNTCVWTRLHDVACKFSHVLCGDISFGTPHPASDSSPNQALKDNTTKVKGSSFDKIGVMKSVDFVCGCV